MSEQSVIQLYPEFKRDVMLQGLYLRQQNNAESKLPHVYTNFITSLDGRIAIEQPVTGERGVPGSITNPRDWRLYQELAARADVLVVSARFLRELVQGKAQDHLPLSHDPAFSDLHAWRVQHGLSPQPAVVILSASLNLPLEGLRAAAKERRVYIATGNKADAESIDAIEASGAKILYAGEDEKVEGRRLVEQLTQEGFRNIYSIAGPDVLETLLRDRMLDSIYLTQVHRLIGGSSYDTLLEGDLLTPPADFTLQVLYYDNNCGKDCSQFFGVYAVNRK